MCDKRTDVGRLPVEPEMVLIPAGSFLMGSDPQRDLNAHAHEQPQHAVWLPDFSMGETPVTNRQYAAFVGATGHRSPDHWQDGAPPPDKVQHPVVYVSWYDASAYCRWLSEVTHKPYRLPSEAEWEKAASWEVGSSVAQRETEDVKLDGRKRLYPWGDRFDPTRCNTKESGIGDTTPIGMYPLGVGPYGQLDVAGNVYEWTRSLWGKDMKEPAFGYPYDPLDGREDTTAGNSVMRVLRGGAFYYDARYARPSCRIKSYPDYRVRTRGFRVCIGFQSK
jgi:formylglycine-generating enzyme required for sulfatase activity